jgi:hypothetical protein
MNNILLETYLYVNVWPYIVQGFDPGVVWNNLPTIITIIVAFILIRSGVGEKLQGLFSNLASGRKELIDEKDAEIARLKTELKTTTQELRAAREFGDEDRAIIRALRSRCSRYVIEINQHRITKNISPILAGHEDDGNEQRQVV